MQRQTANLSRIDWDQIAATKEFQQLLVVKRHFIVRATLFFVVYYFALPLLMGWVPQLMSRPVLGPLNIAYLFALSQFFMAWCIAALYVRETGLVSSIALILISPSTMGVDPRFSRGKSGGNWMR